MGDNGQRRINSRYPQEADGNHPMHNIAKLSREKLLRFFLAEQEGKSGNLVNAIAF
jgi:hypothetical protein